MAYPDELLVEGEQVVVHRHPHWKKIILPVLALLVVVGLGSYLAALAAAQTWAGWGWLVLLGLGLVLVVWLTVIPVIRWRTTHFVVTTRRVLVREGVFTRQGIDIPIGRDQQRPVPAQPGGAGARLRHADHRVGVGRGARVRRHPGRRARVHAALPGGGP